MNEPLQEPLSVTITRTFDAPIELVYEAWTDPKQVVRWMKCEPGVELIYDQWTPAVGQAFSSTMRKPGEWEVSGTGRFVEVDPPRVLAYVQDPHAGMNLPEMTIRVVFKESNGGTELTLTHSGLPSDEMGGIVQGGWTGSMAQLKDHLAGVRPRELT